MCSVDAANPEELKKVDRPLFEDFWERFLASIDALRENKQRTVYRLTLIKGHFYSYLCVCEFACVCCVALCCVVACVVLCAVVVHMFV